MLDPIYICNYSTTRDQHKDRDKYDLYRTCRRVHSADPDSNRARRGVAWRMAAVVAPLQLPLGGLAGDSPHALLHVHDLPRADLPLDAMPVPEPAGPAAAGLAEVAPEVACVDVRGRAVIRH